MNENTPFGVHLLLLVDVPTKRHTYPAGSIVQSTANGTVRFPGVYHTTSGIHFYVSQEGTGIVIDSSIALVIDQPGYFEDYKKPTQEEIDMLVMIHPHIGKSFLMKHLNIT